MSAIPETPAAPTEADLLQHLPEDARQRIQDRWRIYQLRHHPSWWRRLLLFLSLIGPGILVMIADNDAGGVITYAQTGAMYGIGFFIPFLLLMIPVAYIVQEMTVRLGAVTHRGHAEMIWGRYGAFWGVFSLLDLTVANILTLVTEFIGIRVGMSIFSVPPFLSVPVAWIFVASIMIFLHYSTWAEVSLNFTFCRSPSLKPPYASAPW